MLQNALTSSGRELDSTKAQQSNIGKLLRQGMRTGGDWRATLANFSGVDESLINHIATSGNATAVESMTKQQVQKLIFALEGLEQNTLSDRKSKKDPISGLRGKLKKHKGAIDVVSKYTGVKIPDDPNKGMTHKEKRYEKLISFKKHLQHKATAEGWSQPTNTKRRQDQCKGGNETDYIQ